ncbi:hypothetical protein [Microlunatus spumicola]|uniref:hypothetical protein n=1 Tax=Microlunatus spumicola TaxID=81499 RepID=UPI00195C095F
MLEPFTTAQARDAGLTPAGLRGPAVRREHHGAYVEAFIEPDLAVSIAAARLVLPADALLDGVSALQALGLDLGSPRPLRFVSAHPHQVRRPGIRVRRVRARPSAGPHPGSLGPVPALLAAAQELDLVELVAAGDWLVRWDLTTQAALVAAAAQHHGRGAVLARRASALVRDHVDSVRETRLRLCLVLAGLPEPEVNPIVSLDGRRIGRVDLLLRRWRVVIEYEGDQHRTDRRQWNTDISRHEQLAVTGATLVRVTGERMRHPRAVVALVVSALRAGGWAGPDPVFDEEWHRLFPSAR